MKIIKYIKLIPALSLLLMASACDSFLDEDEVSGKYGADEVWAKPGFAEGVLLRAYKVLPGDFNYTSDYASNDLVTNDLAANSRAMAMGGWTERENPLSEYDKIFGVFLQLNDFIAHVDEVDFAPLSEQDVKDRYIIKLKAEAYALRAWWGAELLKTCGGEAADGQLLGYPIVTEVINDIEAAKLPRNTYQECVAQIISDCDNALIGLPLRWVDDSEDPDEIRINGERNINRINGITVKLIKSRVLLRAASPAFASSGTSWQNAADAAADLMADNGGLDVLDPKDVTFYDKGYDVATLNSSPEILWYYGLDQTMKGREERNYPPTLFGTARVNPSQNLVDCFPASNGYPILHPDADYDAENPYDNRDSRLASFVVYNNAKIGKNTIVTTETDDAIGATINSTRTGYYLRKFINPKVDLTPGKVIQAPGYFVSARYTEALLNFAEAANEAGGPEQNIGGFSAKQVINALRVRAGISDQTYVNSLDKDGLRELIKNERRIEMCFEGFRFWDMCRWKDLAAMNTNVTGIDSKTNSLIEVEERVYEDYMIYAPIPNKERVLGIVQNKGWK